MKIRPKEFAGSDITLVDIGSRNGMTDLRSIGDMVIAYGFEPSGDEYEKLANSSMDIDKKGRGWRPKYLAERYFPYAIAANNGPCNLFITKGPGASSTLKPNSSFVKRFLRDDWGTKFDILRTETVPARRLADFVSEASISRIDLLKLDTQGNEFDILNDRSMLSRISIIKTEVEFVPLYAEQKLYPDIATLMTANGFMQFDLCFHKVHYRGLNSESLGGGVLSWADAYFINEEITERAAVRAQMLVLLDLGNDDLALDVARRTGAATDEDFFAVRSWFLNYRRSCLTLRQRLQRSFEQKLGVRLSRIAK